MPPPGPAARRCRRSVLQGGSARGLEFKLFHDGGSGSSSSRRTREPPLLLMRCRRQGSPPAPAPMHSHLPKVSGRALYPTACTTPRPDLAACSRPWPAGPPATHPPRQTPTHPPTAERTHHHPPTHPPMPCLSTTQAPHLRAAAAAPPPAAPAEQSLPPLQPPPPHRPPPSAG